GVFLYISRFLDPHTISNARAVCRPWRRAFSLNVHTARLEIREHRAAQARTFMRAFVRAFPYTTKLVLDITFRRTAREKIQTALEEHFLALQDFGLQVLQLNLDLNSFNERKIKLLDVSLLASWGHLTRLVLQESGWRSQQLRVDANTVFSSLPALQELSVVCKYSGHVKAKWWRPPPPSNHQHKHLRCQLTQNQSMSGELQKALKRITPALQQHVSALTFEIVEETYPEPSRCATPLELSALPGLKSLTVLSGAEDALSHSKLDLVGATGLETLVLFDVSCGCWCYKKPGHGIPPRLLSAPPAYLRSLTVVGFVVDQCQNLHALSLLTSLEELRLEQPDPDCLAAVAGELLLTWLPSNLRSLKLHSVVLPPCGVPSSSVAAAEAAMAGGAAGPAAAGLPTGWFGGAGCGMDTAATAGGECSSSSNSNNASQLLYGVAPVAPLPQLRELYLSKCKVPTLGLLGVCSQLTALGVINCLSSSGMMPAAAAMPALRSLAVIYTLPPEQEYGSGGVVLSGMMPPPAFAAAAAAAVAGPFGAAAPAASTAAARGGGGGAAAAVPITVASTAAADFGGGGGSILAWSGATAAATTAMPAAMPQQQQHVPGLLLPPVVWGSDEQVAAVAGCRTVTSLELILPRGTAGAAAVASLASLTDLLELDVALPCGLSCCMMGLARLGRSSGGRLRRLTLWVDGRTCVNRENARQLQALQRSLQTRMPDTAVEWAGAESRQGSWTRLEARVFNPH
ncbi:hypothetical protein VOLCADRAFT_117847, partial [Volvox carteri f. nagariensis]